MMRLATKKTDRLPAPGDDPALDRSVLSQVAALKRMSVSELREKWEALFDAPPVSYSRSNLEMRIGYRLQELTYGGIGRETRQMLDALADEVEGKAPARSNICDPRSPVAGTRFVREWEGVEHTVTVLTDGFEWQGRKYKSLSAIARAITGVQWNGWRFFGIRELPRRKK
jgi:hypothetical protein